MAKQKFIFEPETKGAETKNTVFELYTLYKKTAVKNPKFKLEFVKTLKKQNNFGSSAKSLLEIYRITGELKCVCCNSKEAHFRFVKNNNTIMLQPYVETELGEKMLTVDHDILASMGGTNAASNLKPLCSTCNGLRGSRFAGYQEFKEWYDNTPPNHRTVMPTPNFCFINFLDNLNDGNHAKTITGATCIPPVVKKNIIKEFRRGGNSPFEKIMYGKWVIMNRVFVNDFFSTLVYERIRHGHNIQGYEKETVDFFDFPTGMTDQRHRRNHVQNKINLMISRARKAHKLAVNSVKLPEHDVPAVAKHSFISKIVSYARNVFA
jgi:hypothetical protein